MAMYVGISMKFSNMFRLVLSFENGSFKPIIDAYLSSQGRV